MTIDELMNGVNADPKNKYGDTHERTVFPEPATKQSVVEKKREDDSRTKAMDPKQATRGFPFPENVALSKPLGSATEMCIASDVVIRPWIRCRQPTPNVVL